MDNKNPAAEALAVNGSLIATVGSNKDILAMKSAKTVVIDLQGRTLVPGFNDSHLHVVGYGMNRSRVDLRACRSLEELVDTIRNFIEDHNISEDEWVFGWGWNQSLFKENRMPNRYDLDKASKKHCVAILRTCCHLLSANSAALKTAGIDDQAQQIEGGKIETDSKGIPTGVLSERAMLPVKWFIPSIDSALLKKMIIDAADDFIAAGLTTVQTDDLMSLGADKLPLLFKVYSELAEEGSLPIRVNLQLQLPEVDLLKDYLETGYNQITESAYLKSGPLKLIVDGSIGGKTAYISESYIDDPECFGIPVLAEEELGDLVRLAHSSGMQIAAHAIGDAAVTMVLDAYEDAYKAYPHPDSRFRVIHASVVSDKDLERFKKLSVIANIQPSFIASDYGQIKNRFSKGLTRCTYRWKDFSKRGIVLAGSSDSPIEPHEPLIGLHAAITRRDAFGMPKDGWYAEQSLNMEEALKMYTFGSAYSEFEESTKGTLEKGKIADMVILSEDITKIDPFDLKDVTVDTTFVGGKIAYNRHDIRV